MKTTKENKLREEWNKYYKYWERYPDKLADYWLQKRQSEFAELERRIKGICFKGTGQDLLELDRVLSILNEMRGEK